MTDIQFNAIMQRFDSMEKTIDNVESKVNIVEKEVKSVKLTLELETNKNISVIAENHNNINQKLNEELKTLEPNVMYKIKVNQLDGDAQKLKLAVGIN